MDNQSNKWFKKTWAIILLLIFFFPAGLFLMWKYTTWSPKAKWIITGIFVLLIIVNGAVQNNPNEQNQPTNQTSTVIEAKTETKPTEQPTQKPTQHELQGDVRFNEFAFLITNTEENDWTECRLEINSGLFKDGYTYSADLIPAKEPLTIPFREFTKGDGTRFDSFETKAQNLSISCKVGQERGFAYFGLK